MTRKLYNEDSMIQKFQAKVLACQELKNGNFNIVLDQTAFFPTGGGQLADAGWLSFSVEGKDIEVEVLDVKESVGEVHHITDMAIPIDTDVTGQLDWPERFSKMQQHTGEHIVSGIVCAKYGYNNVGFHLGEDTVTMDFDGELDFEQLEEIESEANQIIWGCIPIEVLYPTDVELEQLNYRSKIEIEDQVRVVRIPGIDTCACCAPHVLTTGMVGMVKFIDSVKHRGGVRITIVCGNRALTHYKDRCDHSKQISRTLSIKENELFNGVDRLHKECLELKYQVKHLENKMVTSRVEQLLKVKENDYDSMILFEEDFNPDQNKVLANLLLERGVKTCITFVPVDEGQYHFIGATIDGDVRAVANLLRNEFGSKGGGNSQMVQGRVVASKEEIINKLDGLDI